MNQISSIYIEIRIPQTERRNAITGFKTLVITRGDEVNPKGRTCHSNNSSSHLNLRYFLDSALIGICRKSRIPEKSPIKLLGYSIR